MSLQTTIKGEIKGIYDFHEYAISKERIVELSEMIIETMPGVTEDHIKDFAKKVKMGELGIMYKAPSSLMIMFQEYKHVHKIPLKQDNTGGLIPVPGWKYR